MAQLRDEGVRLLADYCKRSIDAQCGPGEPGDEAGLVRCAGCRGAVTERPLRRLAQGASDKS
jgi:hypothetical protein